MVYILFIFIICIAILFQCSIFTFFCRLMIRLHVNGESYDFILFDKALANPNYIPVYMKVYYLFMLCLFKVGRLFSKLIIPKYMFVFVIKLSKEKAYFMYG